MEAAHAWGTMSRRGGLAQVSPTARPPSQPPENLNCGNYNACCQRYRLDPLANFKQHGFGKHTFGFGPLHTLKTLPTQSSACRLQPRRFIEDIRIRIWPVLPVTEHRTNSGRQIECGLGRLAVRDCCSLGSDFQVIEHWSISWSRNIH